MNFFVLFFFLFFSSFFFARGEAATGGVPTKKNNENKITELFILLMSYFVTIHTYIHVLYKYFLH